MATSDNQNLSPSIRRNYESVTASGAGATFTTLVDPKMNFELLAVLVHASAAPSGANNLIIEVDSGIAAATYDCELDIQDMNALLSHAFVPAQPIPFKSDDKIHVYHAASWAATITFQVVWRSI